MRFFKFISNIVQDGKKLEMLHYLRELPKEKIAAAGFSPALMNEGISAWPWREDGEHGAVAKIHQMIDEERLSVQQLESYSDAELRDLGITRGLIKHSVRYGRSGIDIQRSRAA